jgi:hypothetical protein
MKCRWVPFAAIQIQFEVAEVQSAVAEVTDFGGRADCSGRAQQVVCMGNRHVDVEKARHPAGRLPEEMQMYVLQH